MTGFVVFHSSQPTDWLLCGARDERKAGRQQAPAAGQDARIIEHLDRHSNEEGEEGAV